MEERVQDSECATELYIHDLRHHAATMAARMPGLTMKEIVALFGHSSQEVALVYEHATAEHDAAITQW
jgi:integrase